MALRAPSSRKNGSRDYLAAKMGELFIFSWKHAHEYVQVGAMSPM